MTKAFPTSTLNSEPDRDDEVVKRFQRVHYWHKCEVPAGARNVCCWVRNRHAADITKPTRLTTRNRHRSRGPVLQEKAHDLFLLSLRLGRS